MSALNEGIVWFSRLGGDLEKCREHFALQLVQVLCILGLVRPPRPSKLSNRLYGRAQEATLRSRTRPPQPIIQVAIKRSDHCCGSVLKTTCNAGVVIDVMPKSLESIPLLPVAWDVNVTLIAPTDNELFRLLADTQLPMRSQFFCAIFQNLDGPFWS